MYRVLLNQLLNRCGAEARQQSWPLSTIVSCTHFACFLCDKWRTRNNQKNCTYLVHTISDCLVCMCTSRQRVCRHSMSHSLVLQFCSSAYCLCQIYTPYLLARLIIQLVNPSIDGLCMPYGLHKGLRKA